MAVGDAVEQVAVGQRVVINPMNTPSFIGSGGPEGAFTDELLVRDARVGDSLLPIPEDLPYDIAALTEPLAVALHGVNRAEAKPGDKVVVFGCGPIGLGMVLWLVDRGVTDVVALDLSGLSDVTDAFVAISHGSQQYVVRASRELGSDRLDTRVGPLRVEILAEAEGAIPMTSGGRDRATRDQDARALDVAARDGVAQGKCRVTR